MMSKGYFREQKHYRLHEIAQELGIAVKEAQQLAGTLKRYGIVKTVRETQPEYGDLPARDIVLMDAAQPQDGMEYLFDFVGVALVEETAFYCYPKYIASEKKPVRQLKQVMRVLKKYQEKEQRLFLQGSGGTKQWNSLAAALWFLEDYFQYGLYANQQEMLECNGEGEILWDKTIHEMPVLIQDSRPYYMQLYTRKSVENEMDYFGRLHACILTRCTARLEQSGILELFDLPGAELSRERLESFGDTDAVLYRLEQELQVQYVTRKQELLKSIYVYLEQEQAGEREQDFCFYGTGCFYDVWEKVCAYCFGNVLHKKLKELPGGAAGAFAERKEEKLIQMIERPVWREKASGMADGTADTLRPDMVCIYPHGTDGEYCFGIYDAKYYCVDFKGKEDGCRVTGQPGIGDVTKQYLYELAYADFMAAQGYAYVQNLFLCPAEEAQPEYGSVKLEMMHRLGSGLGEIAAVRLCAAQMYARYLADEQIANPLDFLPDTARRRIHEKEGVFAWTH